MSLVTKRTNKADPLQAGVDRVRKLIGDLYPRLEEVLSVGSQVIYGTKDRPNSWTAQMAVDRFGLDAPDLFALSGMVSAIVAHVEGVEPVVMPPGWSYRIDDNKRLILVPPETPETPTDPTPTTPITPLDYATVDAAEMD